MRIVFALLAATLQTVTVPQAKAQDSAVVSAGSASNPAGYDLSVAQLVVALLEYTRWPAATGRLDLCIVGPAHYAGRISGRQLTNGRTVNVRSISASQAATSTCDAVYLGQLSLHAARQITAATRGHSILTIAEADPESRSEAMFSLLFLDQAVSFRLNTEALSRSGLRMDPRVLRLSRNNP